MKISDLISQKLIAWYADNQRILPWRNIHDPYRIWISEIILQQTRVVQGLEYYNRFINRFPDVKSLAEAGEQEVLKYWQGLGYYSRARNLHFAAKTILTEHQGVFPRDYAPVLRLKGIGEYTAAAIVSFAWNEPYPVVDGNVFRFLSRLFAVDEPIDTGKGKKYFTKLAAELMDKSQAGLFNQAIMEFGALHCLPANPNCSNCPFVSQCLAFSQKAISRYPVKQTKTKTKDLFLYYFHICDAESLFLNQRKEKGIWQNLFEFPVIESETPLDFTQLSKTKLFNEWFPNNPDYHFRLVIENKKHVLSHRIICADFYCIEMDKLPDSINNLLKIRKIDLNQYPVHRLMEYYLNG
ncbi:A/G-specific adenine glycosylase [Bacteroidia bacterium]|nr:A/G-specific adenine glycosylase [Bacteroidia bacterium]